MLNLGNMVNLQFQFSLAVKYFRENFKYAWFHQLKPNNLQIPYMDLGWAMKEWWQRDKPKG